ncbi:MAG: glutamine amidotransferase-related protein [Arsenophonus sp. NC-TX2-MAG3]
MQLKELNIFNKKYLFGIYLDYQLLAPPNAGFPIPLNKILTYDDNHRIKDLVNNQIMITTQNHNFAIDNGSLSDKLRVIHKSLFDGNFQSIYPTDKPVFAR